MPRKRSASARPRQEAHVPGTDRESVFEYIDNISIYGGFSGTGSEISILDRDLTANPTILSGDINGDDGPNFTNINDNAFVVVKDSGSSDNTIIDGFHIVGANGFEGSTERAVSAGLFHGGTSLTIQNCMFTGNNDTGIHVVNGASLVVNNSVFQDNNFTGLQSGFSTNVTVVNSVFRENRGQFGGGMNNHDGAIVNIKNCTFYGNTAEFGGGIYNNFGTTTLTNLGRLLTNTAAAHLTPALAA